MRRHIVSISAATAIVVLLVAPGLAADTFQGTLISVGNGQIRMLDMDGKNQHTFVVAKDATITRNGLEARLDDLKPGDSVTVTTEQRGPVAWATVINARSIKSGP